jgi:hypothetical protein
MKGTITVSDLRFHRRIMDRYRRGKVGLFGFPMMVFYKNTLPILKRVMVGISLRLYFSVLIRNSSSVLRNVWDIGRPSSWFWIEKHVSPVLKGIQGLSREIRHRFMLRLPNAILSIGWVSLLPSLNMLALLKSSRVEKWIEMSRPFFGLSVHKQTIRPKAPEMESSVSGGRGSHSHILFKYGSPAVLPRLNPHLYKVFRVYNTSINAPRTDASYITQSGGATLNTGVLDFYFHRQRRIEQEVDEIKRIVIEAGEEIRERSLSHRYLGEVDSAIKRQLDIDRISDQVYRNIERRIRMERERRGM